MQRFNYTYKNGNYFFGETTVHSTIVIFTYQKTSIRKRRFNVCTYKHSCIIICSCTSTLSVPRYFFLLSNSKFASFSFYPCMFTCVLALESDCLLPPGFWGSRVKKEEIWDLQRQTGQEYIVDHISHSLVLSSTCSQGKEKMKWKFYSIFSGLSILSSQSTRKSLPLSFVHQHKNKSLVNWAQLNVSTNIYLCICICTRLPFSHAFGSCMSLSFLSYRVHLACAFNSLKSVGAFLPYI